MSILLESVRRQAAFARLLRALPTQGESLALAGLPGSLPAVVLAALAAADTRRLWVAVAGTPAEAEGLEADVQAVLGEGTVAHFPQRETLPYEAAEHHVEVSGLRVEALEALLAQRVRVLVTTSRALQELAEIPSGLADLRLTLEVGIAPGPAALAARLEELGFERAPLVESVGQFAVRGGILDIFGFGAPDPVRVEFWGDEIASIRHFDILDQRSTRELRTADILPVDLGPATGGPGGRRSLLDVLSRDAILFETEAGAAEHEFRRTWQHIRHLHDAERRRGGDPEPPGALFLDPDAACARIAGFGRLVVHAGPERADAIRFDARTAEPIERDLERLTALLRVGAARGERTLILCDNTGQLERLEELLGGASPLPAGAALAIGSISAGFVLEGGDAPLRVLTDHEIFSRARRLRRGRRFRGAVALESLAQLRPGDFVVHMDHGIGRFRELQHVRIGDQDIEALAIEYANGEVLRVPVYRLDLIERWVSDREEAPTPRLHRIGGRSWKTLRARTERAIQEMATELLQLYAARQLAERTAYPEDTRWQKEMESSFLYDDTPDQRNATADVKRDMESPHPMDRLLCGDVGYGKTEVAIRAAFKAAQDGRQVAFLAPTTILVEQHVHTLQQRLAGYPVRVEAISRFRTAREQQSILAEVAEGRIDIIVGTHRLLEPDVLFRNLGLLVIDEEQRFGVRQKERLKELKHDVDVLSLSATPIPRTMHLSLAGMRDLSLLQTPPRDRMPIITHVLPWVEEVLEDAIHRELDRGGQVFFVHNRVQTIHGVAERVQRIAPDARIAVAHGQMPPAELDAVMRRFLDAGVDVLVTTSIIENGLDVPSANTLIVDRADQFGLAQLYQIRGRVGRSHHRAYCYLIVPEGVSDEAERRLRVLEHYTELGSGYAIAMKDLELRGAGNILGAAQSGFVHAVGLDTYTRLLEENIARLRGEKKVHDAPPEIAIHGAAFLPDDYVPDSAQKLHLYRRLARAESLDVVHALAEETRDRYGSMPPEVGRLFAATRLRLLGQQLGVERVLVQPADARVSFREGAMPRMARLQTALRDRQVAFEVRRTMPFSFVLRALGADDVLDTVHAALEALLPESPAQPAPSVRPGAQAGAGGRETGTVPSLRRTQSRS
jgi:transcription-repair coupling factor (superfamily II helicase)